MEGKKTVVALVGNEPIYKALKHFLGKPERIAVTNGGVEMRGSREVPPRRAELMILSQFDALTEQKVGRRIARLEARRQKHALQGHSPFIYLSGSAFGIRWERCADRSKGTFVITGMSLEIRDIWMTDEEFIRKAPNGLGSIHRREGDHLVNYLIWPEFKQPFEETKVNWDWESVPAPAWF